MHNTIKVDQVLWKPTEINGDLVLLRCSLTIVWISHFLKYNAIPAKTHLNFLELVQMVLNDGIIYVQKRTKYLEKQERQKVTFLLDC
jgi:hypothetical protein